MIDRDALARALGITPEEQRVLDTGNEHNYRCRCDNCKDYWRLMGPDETGTYGPFTADEMKEGK